MKKYSLVIIFGCVFLSFFLYQKLSPFGFACRAKLLNTNHFILGRGCLSIARPSDRRELKDNLIMTGDPLYFSLYSPRKFENLDIEIVFKANLEANVNLGLLVNKDLWQYNLQSIYNHQIDKFQDYYAVYEKPLLLLQKEKKFESIDEWLLAFNNEANYLCPDKEMYQCLSIYNLDLDQKRQIKTYYNLKDLEKEGVDLQLQLKGRHSFYIYLNDEDDLNLYLEFSSPKESEVSVEILKNDYIIYNYQNNSLDPLDISLKNLGEGAYQINIPISDDIFIDRIKTEARAMVFKNRLWPNITSSLDLITNAQSLTFKLLSPENRQEISFKGENHSIEDLFVQHKFDLNGDDNHLIKLEKGALLVEANAYFALSDQLFFNPGFGNLKYSDETDFILANYIFPEKMEDGFLKAKASFKLGNTFYQDNLHNFIISIPGLRAEDDSDNELIIKSIDFKFYDQTSFLSKIRRLIIK